MDALEYCDNVAVQLTIWKQELYEVAITADRFQSPGKQVVAPELTRLMVLIDEIGKKIQWYKDECPRQSSNKESVTKAGAAAREVSQAGG